MKVLITGYGRMGRLIEDTLVKAGDEIAGWIDIENVENLNSDKKIADVIMDFSNPSLTDTVVAYAARTETPLLSGTTNMTEEQHQLLAELAKRSLLSGRQIIPWASICSCIFCRRLRQLFLTGTLKSQKRITIKK